MITHSLIEFLSTPHLAALTVVSLLGALITLDHWKKHHDFKSVYAHLVFLMAPLILFTWTASCSMGLLETFTSICSIGLAKLVVLFGLITSILVLLLGAIIGPEIYHRSLKSSSKINRGLRELIRSTSRKAKLHPPTTYIISTPKPMAFSFSHFKSKVFLSTGLINLLSDKELEAVILHELGHIKHRSSWAKISSVVLKTCSPIAAFSDDRFTDYDECRADGFAIDVQGTRRHIESARRKIAPYSSAGVR